MDHRPCKVGVVLRGPKIHVNTRILHFGSKAQEMEDLMCMWVFGARPLKAHQLQWRSYGPSVSLGFRGLAWVLALFRGGYVDAGSRIPPNGGRLEVQIPLL